jgi:hypothetical protein
VIAFMDAITLTAWSFRPHLGPAKRPCIHRSWPISDLTVEDCGFIGRPSEQKEPEWAWSSWIPKSLKRLI